MYHAIGTPLPLGLAALSVPTSLLAEHVAALSGAGYRLTGLTRALEAPEGEHVVALTFDDGFCDFLDNAVGVLETAGAGATQYVPTSTIGGTADWLPGEAAGLRLMDDAALREVAAAGIEIGSHNDVHVPMDVLPRAVVAAQVAGSRARLEDTVSAPVRSFCYPHGYHGRSVRRAVRAAGFDNACAIGHRLQAPAGDRYAVQRLMVTPGHDPDGLLRLVEHGVPGVVPTLKRYAGPGWRAARWAARKAGRTWT
jgi:peptidoglycan/xylan/chitin deacetylase (PgdA/CDA1 family)